MEKEYNKLFQKNSPALPPEGFSMVVLARIGKEQKSISHKRLFVSVPLAFLSGVAVVATSQYLMQDLAQSGVPGYFSVLFSDSGAVLTYWREFSISLAGQMPILGITLFLGATLALLGSLSSVIKNLRSTLTYA